MIRLRITIIQEVFPDYRKAIFDLLDNSYTLQVIHGRQSNAAIHTVLASYSQVCRIFRFGSLLFMNCFHSIIRFKPKVVIHQGSPGIISLPLVWLLCKLLGIKFIIWTHGYERTQGFHPRRSLRSRLRLIYFKMSDAVIFYTESRKKFFMQYLDEHKLFYAKNTLDSELFGKYRNKLITEDLHTVKNDLGWTTFYNLVFIGRMLKEKLPDHLIQAYHSLPDPLKKNTTLHFVGNGEMYETLKSQYASHKNLRFYGAVYDPEVTARYLFAADALIIPGYLGLSVVHALLMSTPVISYRQGPNGPYHSPEIEFLKDGFNGILVEPYNVNQLAESIEKLLSGEGMLEYLKRNIRATHEDYSIYNMKQGFDESVRFVLGNCINP